jgi:hypothetical protein
MFGGAFGGAGAEVVIEEFLEGEEVSFFALTDGATIVPFGSAQDHKRVGDGDTGPNTGGMGAYSPAPVLDPLTRGMAIERFLAPTVKTMADAAGEHRAILRKNVNRPAVDLAESRNHSVRRKFFFRHAEVCARGFRQHELLDKAAGIQELVDAVPGGEFPFGTLLGDGFRIAFDGFPLQRGKPLFKLFSGLCHTSASYDGFPFQRSGFNVVSGLCHTKASYRPTIPIP